MQPIGCKIKAVKTVHCFVIIKRQRSILSIQVYPRREDSGRQAWKQERWGPLRRFCLLNICSDARSAQRQPRSQRCCIVFQIKQENPLVPTNPALALCCAIILLGSQLIWHPLHIQSNLQKVLNWITEPRSWQIPSRIMLQLCLVWNLFLSRESLCEPVCPPTGRVNGALLSNLALLWVPDSLLRSLEVHT